MISAHKIIYYESSQRMPVPLRVLSVFSGEESFRFRSLALVKKELQDISCMRKVPQVKFVDRTFNCNPRRTVESIELDSWNMTME